jgi:DNA processing protein
VGEIQSSIPDRERMAVAWMVHRLGRARVRRLLDDPAQGVDACMRAALAEPGFAAFRSACERAALRILMPADAVFPPLLRHIPDPPMALYVTGSWEVLSRRAVAVVGARRCTRPGAAMAHSLGCDLARAGVVVVSGLARGIDAAAHRGALSAGVTVAVLGGGLARIYPASHRGLAAEILRTGGAMVSELPPHEGPRKHHFPERNRLISGLSLGVVVVEAGERSGSLITARLALEQGREVLAVPGSVTNPVARGCHRLLRDGAALVECTADVLNAVGVAPPGPDRGSAVAPTSRELAQVLAAIAADVTPFDAVVAASGLGAEACAAHLVTLELHGFVEQTPGGYIRRPGG